MAFDVGNTQDRSRLWKSIQRSRDAIALFDTDRTEMLRDFAGPLYSPYAPRKGDRYVNKMNLTASIYQTVLCYNNPQVKITSFDPKLWPFCHKYETGVNRVVADMNLRAVMQECVLDAFFLLGVAKVLTADAGLKEVQPNVWMDPGKPWVDRVSFSDLILDMPGRSIRSMRFYGDRYRSPFEAVKSRDDYDSKVLAKMSPSSKSNQNVDSERGDQIALGNSVDDDELEPMCWLMDVYLPRERQLVTFSADNDTLPPLKVDDWKGSERGPYKFLPFGYVPDNIIPTTPAQQLLLLDRLMNRIYGKLAGQAKRQKNYVLVPKGSEKDGEANKQAKDGEYVMVIDPKSSVFVNTPGPDPSTNAFYLAANEIYNVQSGNERVIGGLGMEADTATQEQMLARGAGGRIGFLKGQVNDFASEICREIGSLMWDDEYLTVESSIEAEHTGIHISPEFASWRPGDRQGMKDHYDFVVEPNSMTFRPPEAKLQNLKQFASDYLQMMPAIQAGVFDGQEFTRIYAEYTNTPEILRLAKQMQVAAAAGDPHEATKAPVTERNVTRTSQNRGPQGQGMQAVLAQMMQGQGNRQPAMAGAGR